MKKYYNILFCCIAALAVLSCGKDGPIDNTPTNRITFAPYIPQTKGFIEDISTTGNTVIVYDIMDTVSNTPVSRPIWYLDGVSIVCDANGDWNYADDVNIEEFLWLDKTNHHFFGWLNMENTLVNPSFSKESKSLSINKIKFESTTNQYDFMYSEVYNRYYEKVPANGGRPDSSPIQLEMKHLFSAFRFYIQNLRNADIEIKSISLTNMYTEKSAIIDFSAYPAAVSYPENAKEDLENTSIGVLKSTDQKKNVFSQGDKFFMIWPQTEDEFSAAEIVISYEQEGGTFEKRFKLKELGNTDWAGGKRYSYNITFTDKEVSLICTVDPWQTEDETIDFTDNVLVTHKMDWVDSSLPDGGHNVEDAEVILKNNKEPGICQFQIDAPLGATWYASLISIDGQADAFEFEGNNYGKVGEPAELKVKVTNNSPYSPTHKAKLRIVVVVGTRTIVVNDLIESTTQHEYTIIQNRI